MKFRYLAIIIAITILLLLVGCGKKEAPAPVAPAAPAPVAPAAPAETTPSEGGEATEGAQEAGVVEIPETEMGPGIVTEEGLETGDYTQHSLLGEPQNSDTELAVDYTAEPVRFSNFDCVKDEETGIRYITLKVTNTNSERPFMISSTGVSKGYDTYFLIRGLVDKNPGCQVEELAPGESTVCLKVGMDTADYGNPEGTNRLVIQSPDNEGRKASEAVVVNCPA